VAEGDEDDESPHPDGRDEVTDGVPQASKVVAQTPQEDPQSFAHKLTLDNRLGLWYHLLRRSAFAEGETMQNQQMRFTVDLDKSQYRAFKKKAFEHELPMTTVARRLIQAWLDGEVSVEEEAPPSDK